MEATECAWCNARRGEGMTASIEGKGNLKKKNGYFLEALFAKK
jgi:hypothetical protein